MRKRIIAGNWKMNKKADEAVNFVETVKHELPESDQVEAVICPPTLYITPLLAGTMNTKLQIGAQTMHDQDEGAFTGETSPMMLANLGVPYVIIGHSERRQYFNETDETVNAKVKAALDYGISPIVCVGESLEVREDGKALSFVADQVKAALQSIDEEKAKNVVIAYEPIWAIGTGKTATADDANEVCHTIRETVKDVFGEDVSEAVRIQYGGSVNPSNIEELLSKSDIDGALVGGASLETDSFLQLVEAGANA